MSRLQTKTADQESSIWKFLPEDTFRQHLVALEKCTNAVPIEPQTFTLDSQNLTTRESYTLPLETEQQIADDFAFLAAIEEGAQSVAAVCLEQHLEPPGFVVRFAALDLSLSDEVKDALNSITKLLSTVTESEESTGTEELFSKIVDLHFRRLLARLRSSKWEKPKYLAKQHKKPLWQDFSNLTHRIQFVYTKKEASLRREVEALVQQLASIYEAFETMEPGSQDELSSLQKLIKATYNFCKTEQIADFARRLEHSVTATPTPKVASAIKCLRQIEKLGAYWRVCTSLVSFSLNFPTLFQGETPLGLEFLTPYQAVETKIGYETWATSCHVHAEVQLAVYYDLLFQSSTETLETFLPPRVIGTSKWLCYLCYQFLRAHGRFLPANTHGRLYDQWTIPDLAEYKEELRARYQGIVSDIDAEVVRETGISEQEGVGSILRWRAEPMTSRQNLLGVDGAC
ncbi:uncharacterized protein M437DRAFT_57530 [Aureobasidium melanogenum CBS 110374]|uniref:Uncharacterized protein n=1 Tax=Aureobasidium melanogenum (strain CBS 110374) TaxID=1043003 RepID=A0A074W9J7_AURM1|nr:uncharacterized protein M437DRAFT_57530 [Aureobasidium melanogenum CBS 110374]KEQ59196.1 hypothetical protein M437DRAFT_57530 [Aureobasidium melanogenum CBS 110374]